MTIEFNENDVRKVARGAGISFFGSLFGAGIYGLSHLIIARFLGAELFGIYSLGFAIFGVAEILSRIGLHEGAVRYVALYLGEGDYRRAKGVVFQSITFSFIVGVAIGAILFLSSGFIAERIFHNISINNVIKLFSLGVPFGASLIVALYVTRGFQKIRYFVGVRNFFNPLVNLSLIGVFYIAGFKLYGAICAWIISAVLSLVVTLFLINRELKVAKDVKPLFETSKLITFSLPLSISDFLFFLIMWTDALMLGYFKTEVEVGIYRVAVQIAFILTIFLRSFVTIFAPVISDLYNRNKRQQLENLFKITAKWISFLTLPACIIVAFLARDIMALFGDKFVLGSYVLVILIVAQLIRCSIGPARHMLIMSGHHKIILFNDIAVAGINVLLNFLLIPQYGMHGAAIATGISIVLMSFVQLVEVFHFLKMHSFKISFLKGLIAAGVCIVFLGFIKEYISEDIFQVKRLLIISCSTLIVYLISIFVLKLDAEDKFVLSMVAGKLRGKGGKEYAFVDKRIERSAYSAKRVNLNRENLLVSIIIVTFNRRRYLRELLLSLEKQDYENYEIIIVDNGSQDGTEKLFESEFKNEKIKYLRQNTNKGASAGRNIAINESKGGIIIGLDDDVEIVEKDAVSKIVDKLINDESIGVLAFKIVDYFNKRLQKAAFPMRDKMVSHRQEFETSWFIAAGCAMRRDVFKEVGVYGNFSYKGNEEIDLSYRILDAGYRILYFPSVTVLHKKKQDEKISGSCEYFTTFLENRIKVAVLNLPLHYVLTTSSLWTFRILLCAHGDIRPIFRAWKNLFLNRNQLKKNRKVIKKQTVFRIRRLKGPLVY